MLSSRCVWVSSVLCVLQVIGPQATRAMTLLPDIPLGDPLDFISDVPGLPLSTSEIEEFGGPGFGVFRETGSEFSDEGRGDPTTSAGLFEGDIVIKTAAELRDLLQENAVGRSAINDEEKLWPGGVVPYVISASFNSRERKMIGKAFKSFHRNTCLRFLPRNRSQKDYIYIYKGNGCSSSVGRQGGKQGLSIGWGCLHHGIILHELMHAAGFWHEQSRYDRDRHVIIHWDNIETAQRYNFNKHESGPTTTLGLAYDYNSLMHYNSHAFALDLSRPTIEPRKQGFAIGQRKDFSKLDLSGLNLLYSCPSGGSRPRPTSRPPTTSGSDCRDNHPQCSNWAAKGQCIRNTAIMNEHCAKSCKSCRDKKQLSIITFPS
ncbi:unnamed protein product [Meganyctiphanes norvegica]|uniref:Metalloendopeptidase n=1 Tax=Meganyctiphanes norvegica TaxID=48144 RepID=A0AAV2S5P6_MEGNR